MLAFHANVKRDTRALAAAIAKVDTARATLERSVAAERAGAADRDLHVDDPPAFKRHMRFLRARADYDERIKLAQIAPVDAWQWVEEADYDWFDGHCHFSGDTCWFQGNLDRRGEFSGYWECMYNTDVRMCDVCYSNCHDLATIAGKHQPHEVVEDILEEEHYDRFENETANEALARALAPEGHDQWRAFSGIVHCECVICERNSDFAHVLVGQPAVRLCAEHHGMLESEERPFRDETVRACVLRILADKPAEEKKDDD